MCATKLISHGQEDPLTRPDPTVSRPFLFQRTCFQNTSLENSVIATKSVRGKYISTRSGGIPVVPYVIEVSRERSHVKWERHAFIDVLTDEHDGNKRRADGTKQRTGCRTRTLSHGNLTGHVRQFHAVIHTSGSTSGYF